MSDVFNVKMKSFVRDLGDFCLGYGLSHVFIFYVLSALILKPVGFYFFDQFQASLNVDQVANLILLAIANRLFFGDRTSTTEMKSLGVTLGVVFFVVSHLLVVLIK